MLKKLVVTHRHGDRTPITPLRDTDYWNSTLVDPKTLQEIAEPTRVLHGAIEATHVGAGQGPYGKLTKLGLSQMTQLGHLLRETYVRYRKLTPSDVQIFSTDFPRTLQSAQALLTGLFPERITNITIDATKTN